MEILPELRGADEMNCPNCYSGNVYVIDSRQVSNGNKIRRRRKCADCDHRFNSIEFLVDHLTEAKVGNENIYLAPVTDYTDGLRM